MFTDRASPVHPGVSPKPAGPSRPASHSSEADGVYQSDQRLPKSHHAVPRPRKAPPKARRQNAEPDLCVRFRTARGHARLSSTDAQDALLEVDLIPAQVHDLGRPEPVPKG